MDDRLPCSPCTMLCVLVFFWGCLEQSFGSILIKEGLLGPHFDHYQGPDLLVYSSGGIYSVIGARLFHELKRFVRFKFSCLNFCALQVFVFELISPVRFFASFQVMRNT